MKNNQRQHKKLEKLFFDEFLRCHPTSLVGGFNQPDPDPPDIEFATADGKIGVEIGRCFPNANVNSGADHCNTAKEQETLQDKAVDKARQIYVQEPTNPSVRLLVEWNRDARLRSGETSLYAEKIAETVVRFIPEPGSEICLGQTLEENVFFPPKINRLFIRRTTVIGDIIWSSNRVGWFQSLSKDDLERIFVCKSKKLKKCRNNYDKLWLLIVAEGSRPSSWYQVTQEVREHLFTSLFNDAFFFNMFTREVTILRVSPR